MKRTLSLILVAMMCVFMLTGCCLSHEWVEADCTNPRYCAKCDKTDGEALGHDVVEADCLNPSSCTRCGMTEGEALGHDWAEADCENAKTCTRCGETEGEALGHSYTGWKATGTDTMANTCETCGDKDEQPLDREFIGRQNMVGKWELTSLTMNETWFDYAPGWTLDIREDGTFDFKLTELETGEITYVEFYDGDNMDFYVFDGDTNGGSYSLNYEPVEDVIYIIGQEFFKFTRVEE